MSRRSCGVSLFSLVFLVLLSQLGASPPPAQENKPTTPESLIRVLAEGAASLEKDIAAAKTEADAVQPQIKQAEESLHYLRTQVANLKAAQAVGELQLHQAQQALAGFSEENARLATRIKELQEQRERLAKQIDDRIKALADLKQQVEGPKAAKHPLLATPKFRQIWDRHQKMAKQYQAAAGQLLERRDEVLRVMGEEHQILSLVIGDLQTYIEAGWKEELLKRQTLRSLYETGQQTLRSLWEAPERLAGHLADPGLRQKAAATMRANWAPALGLLALFLILARTTAKVRRSVSPTFRQWQTDAPTMGAKVIFTAGEIVAGHLFWLSLGAWLVLLAWVLGWWQTAAARIIILGVFVWVGLRLGLQFIQRLFGGEEQGRILPLDEETARFYRLHLKLLWLYGLILGVFGLSLLRRLGLEAASYDMLEEIIQVGFLIWVIWLLRRRYFEALRTELPGPEWVKRPAVFVALRVLLLTILGAIIITGLLGFHYLSAAIAKGATLTGVAVVLFGVLWQSARAVLEHILTPSKARVAKKVRKQEELLKKYYFSLLRLLVALLGAGAILIILNLWGLPFSFLTWLFQGLTCGPRLGPFYLSPANLVLAFLTLYGGRWVSGFLRTLLEARFYPRTDWDQSLRYTISSILHYSILAVAILMALGYLGVSFGDVAIVAGGLGVGIGFGLQNIVNNFISGLILLFERPIKVGDMLVIDGQWGQVKEIRVRSTIFQTFDRSVLIIPNSDLISNKILNWTHYGSHINRLTLKIGVSYDSDPHQVTRILEEVCRTNPWVVAEPPPQIFFEAYGDSALNFNIWVYLKSPGDRVPATHELNSAIFTAFQEQGIQIPFPQRDLHIRSWPEAGGSVPLPPKARHDPKDFS